jgi:serine phosphatase RsbU (regulator of sigma subunit)
MDDVIKDIRASLGRLSGELENFQEIAKYLKPTSGEAPQLKGLDIYGESMPLNGLVGGDHIIYVDFKKRYDLDARIEQAKKDGDKRIAENLIRCKSRTGIGILDVSGHQITDAMLAGMMHQAFLLGAIYEMDHFGTITEQLFENLNTRFYNSSSVSKFITMIYGEIAEDDTFKFISAAHPMPIVFSNAKNRIVEISQDFFTNYPPIGTLPSQDDIDRSTTTSVLGYKQKYRVNTWTLMGSGDILLLYTDGLSEHIRGEEEYYPVHLEKTLRKLCDRTAKEIVEGIKTDLLAFNEPSDDISMVVIKRI